MVKGTTIKKKKKEKTPRELAWDAVSKYLRVKGALEFGGKTTLIYKADGSCEEVYVCPCITCNNVYPAWKTNRCLHAGHLLPGRSNVLLFDEVMIETGIKPQCRNCNVNKNGYTLVFRKKIIALYGENYDEKLEEIAAGTLQLSEDDYKEIIKKYTAKTEEMLKELEQLKNKNKELAF